MVPETQYVESGGYYIAYQVFGEGDTDLMIIPGFTSNVEIVWEQPRYERWLRRMASFCRVILIDKRGTGLPDRVSNDNLPTLEERCDDVKAVLDAVGSKRTAFMGLSEGGAMSVLFAASYPERTSALIMYGSFARTFFAPDYDCGFAPEQFQGLLDSIKKSFGKPEAVQLPAQAWRAIKISPIGGLVTNGKAPVPAQSWGWRGSPLSATSSKSCRQFPVPPWFCIEQTIHLSVFNTAATWRSIFPVPAWWNWKVATIFTMSAIQRSLIVKSNYF
jgi:pimeloyl-ACP methyl ester carboxylesterase